MTDGAEIKQRIEWLERKMVQVLWGMVSLVSAGVGVAISVITVDAEHVLLRIAVWLVSWLLIGWFLQRNVFKGAPAHIRFIDP